MAKKNRKIDITHRQEMIYNILKHLDEGSAITTTELFKKLSKDAKALAFIFPRAASIDLITSGFLILVRNYLKRFSEIEFAKYSGNFKLRKQRIIIEEIIFKVIIIQIGNIK